MSIIFKITLFYMFIFTTSLIYSDFEDQSQKIISNPNKNEPVKARIVVSRKTVSTHPVIGDKVSKIYHEPDCKLLKKKKKKKELLEPFGFPSQAIEKRYQACQKCITFLPE